MAPGNVWTAFGQSLGPLSIKVSFSRASVFQYSCSGVSLNQRIVAANFAASLEADGFALLPTEGAGAGDVSDKPAPEPGARLWFGC